MTYDYKNKTANVRQLNNYMYAKTLSMFEYEGLPPSIPVRELERLLQIGGYAFITTAPNGKLYAFHGGLGGLPCPYGNPTEIVIANPALEFYKTLKLKTDGVLIRNDDLAMGLEPLFNKCNMLLVENDINMVLHGYSTRMQKLISASDDKTKDSANAYLKKVVEGEVSIVAENALFDGVKIHGTATDSVGVTGMVEYHQYIKSLLLGEIGLSTNFNMKKERLISAEVDQQDDSTFPYVYNMMKCRLAGVKRINEMFGTNIDVDFGSVWDLKNRKLVDDIVGNNDEQLINELNETGTTTDELVQPTNDVDTSINAVSVDNEEDGITERELDEVEALIDEMESLDLEVTLDEVETVDLDDALLDEVETVIIDENLDYIEVDTVTEEELDQVEAIEIDALLDEVESIKLDEELEYDPADVNTGSGEIDSTDSTGLETEEVVNDVVDVVTDAVIEVLEDLKISTSDEIEEILDAVNTSKDNDNATV